MEDMDLWSNENGMLIEFTVDTLFRDIRIVGKATDSSGEIGFDAGANLYNRGVHQCQNISIEDYEVGFSFLAVGVLWMVVISMLTLIYACPSPPDRSSSSFSRRFDFW